MFVDNTRYFWKVFAKCHGDMDKSLGSLDRREVHKMMNPLLRLRQACCHPQLVRGKIITMSLQKSSVTMEELLDRLILKTKAECVDCHRQIIFALNGLAGIHVLKEEIVKAIEKYREAMSSWETNSAVFKTDQSQKIHTLYNLSSLLKTNPIGCGRTLQDDSLDEKYEVIKQEYLALITARVKSATDKLENVQCTVQEGYNSLDSESPWWVVALNMAENEGVGGALVHELKEMLTEAMMSGRIKLMTTIADRFHDIRGLSLVVHLALEEIQCKRDKAVDAVDKLVKKLPAKEEIQMAAACHLRNIATQMVMMEKCAGCQAENLLMDYEHILFAIREQTSIQDEENDGIAEALDEPTSAVTKDGQQRNIITWGDSEVERVLKHIASFLKNQNPGAELVNKSQTHLSLLDNMKKEFRALRGLWIVLDQRMAALDELEMATSRLRFRQPGEPVSDIPDPSVIEACDVKAHTLQFESDLHVGREELRRHLGQLKYLQTLEKKQDELTEENTSPCPICATELGVEWAVLTCGHCVCCTCSYYMIDRARSLRTNISCPLCRFITQPTELTYVSVNFRKPISAENGVTVKGSHSTKVEAIIDCVLRIRSEDPDAKILVFSKWVTVLKILSRAMDENDITYRLVIKGRNFHKTLSEFKQRPDVRVCLMPLHSGSQGLNIVEATYVLMVEPTLNPANDQQAVGRVYRIGQTKCTYVYRFYVDHTIESRIYEFLQHKSLSGGSSASASTQQPQTEAEQLTVADLSHLLKDTNASSAKNHSRCIEV
jgi:E3 ubiquitin-protein ligase SHPRH